MDIHRCRFVPYPPHSINALAFSHTSNPNEETPKALRLAVGRGNGDVEIWSPIAGEWYQESILRGGKDRSIEGLVWTQDVRVDLEGLDETSPPRLFSIGDSSSITEWDLALGIPTRHVSGNAGDIWCIAAQPPYEDSSSRVASTEEQSAQLLAAGCGSGEIVLFSTSDRDLQYSKSLPVPAVRKPKVLSICWRDRATVVSGYDDSTIRVFNVNTRSTIRSMSLGSSPDGGESYVWCVKCLRDGTILSGDSTGEMKVWEAKNLSLNQRLKTHAADVLDIGAGTAGDKAFSVGLDRRTVGYHQTATKVPKEKPKWEEAMHVRFHQHDVKSLATFESKELSVMASGGVDTALIVTPLRKWMIEYHRTLNHLPQRPQVAVSRSARLLLAWWDRELWLWHIRHPYKAAELREPGQGEQRYSFAARLTLKDEENVTSADISESGKFILVSTSSNVKLFQLRWSVSQGQPVMRSRQISLPASMYRFGAREVKFLPDEKWLVAIRLDNTVVLSRLLGSSASKGTPIILDKVVRLTRPPREIQPDENNWNSYLATISQLTFSPDGRILVVADRSGTINVWVLEGNEDLDQKPAAVVTTTQDQASSDESDSDIDDEGDTRLVVLGQRWIRHPIRHALPNLGSSVLALAVRPLQGRSSTAAMNGNVGLHATRHNPHPVSHELPLMDQRLVAVTARHEIVEFDLATGKFTDWTRRNPAHYLPPAFTRIKDRALNCFFDCTNANDRLWLYGPSWLFMLNMSQDLPIPHSPTRIGNYEVRDPSESPQKKRKVSSSDRASTRQRNTGAGDEMVSTEKYLGVGKPSKAFQDAHHEDVRLVRSSQPTQTFVDAMDIEDHYDSLTLMRRAHDGSREQEVANGSSAVSTQADDEHAKRTSVQQQTPFGHWLTFNYRSIFGALPLTTRPSSEAVGGDSGDEQMEVVLIERPIYDVDLPPRFGGGQDWDV